MSRIKNTNLTIFNDSTDLSFKLSNFKDQADITISESKYLYLGFRKSIHSIYIDYSSKTSINGSLSIEKWNGSAWTGVDFQDNANHFEQSGFIFTDDMEDEAKTTINSQEMFFWRISTTSATDSVIKLRYINVIFNDFDDLKAQEPEIERYYPLDPSDDSEIESFTLSMIAARNEILKRINQSGKKKYNGTTVKSINQWDILDVNELRLASTYYSLYKVFSNIVDNKDNNYAEIAKNYMSKFERAFNLFANDLLTLDTDDDGKVDESERTQSQLKTYKIER